ncbi:MAG: zinc dependent phospholipase C family protein [Faecalibacterium sp.]
MPSTYAHRRFGADVLAQLPGPMQERIGCHRELFDIGLHGPDIFFYYHALRSNPVSRMGFEMHEEPGEIFFERAYNRLARAEDPEAALAYVRGFLCHFALDSTCHPYVERVVRENGISHNEIETALDNALVRLDRKDPAKFFTASHIHPTQENARVIAQFFDPVTEEQTLEALKGMVRVLRLLHVTGPVKRQVLLTGMRAVGKYESLNGLVAELEPNARCAKSTARLRELYAQALPLAQRLILAYPEQGAQDAAYKHTFGEN